MKYSAWPFRLHFVHSVLHVAQVAFLQTHGCTIFLIMVQRRASWSVTAHPRHFRDRETSTVWQKMHRRLASASKKMWYKRGKEYARKRRDSDTTVRLTFLSNYTLGSNIRDRRHVPSGAGASMTRWACDPGHDDDGWLRIGIDFVVAVGTRSCGAYATRPLRDSDLISMANADFLVKARTWQARIDSKQRKLSLEIISHFGHTLQPCTLQPPIFGRQQYSRSERSRFAKPALIAAETILATHKRTSCVLERFADGSQPSLLGVLLY